MSSETTLAPGSINACASVKPDRFVTTEPDELNLNGDSSIPAPNPHGIERSVLGVSDQSSFVTPSKSNRTTPSLIVS